MDLQFAFFIFMLRERIPRYFLKRFYTRHNELGIVPIISTPDNPQKRGTHMCPP